MGYLTPNLREGNLPFLFKGAFMIKTIRNSNTNRVVGILVNGKRYSLGKDICHALGLEEELMCRKSKELRDETLRIKDEIEEREFLGEALSLKVKIRFNSNNTINGSESIVDFTNDIPKEDRDFALGILEDFVDALNEAQERRTKLLAERLKGSYSDFEDVA